MNAHFQRLIWTVLIVVIFTACKSTEDSKNDDDIAQVAIFMATPVFDPLTAGFIDGMTELGYVEGDNVAYTVVVSPDFSMTDSMRDSLKAKAYDVVVVVPAGVAPTSYVTDIRAMLPNTPLVFAPSGTDPVVEGYADSLNRPGQNTTGVLLADADERRFQLFLQMLPDASKLAVVYDPTNPTGSATFQRIQELATEAGVELATLETPVGNLSASIDALEAFPDDSDGIFLLKAWNIADWLNTSAQRRLPISVDSADVDGFFVMAYGSGMDSIGHQAAGMVVKILNGVSAGDLPIETSDFVLTVHLGAANAIGLDISEAFLEQANTIVRDPVTLPAVDTLASTGACDASVTVFGETNTICVTVACADLANTQFLTYTNQTDTVACTETGLIGICETTSFATYYYDGDAATLATGCGFQSGIWQAATTD